MNEILANSYFKDFIIPLLAVFITIGVKVVSRRDTFMQMSRDDFAIGFDLVVSSLILLATYSSKIAIELHENKAVNPELCKSKLEYLPWILFFAVLGLWGLSTFVRKYGWINNSSQTLRMWPGVIIPLILGLVALLLTVNFIE